MGWVTQGKAAAASIQTAGPQGRGEAGGVGSLGLTLCWPQEADTDPQVKTPLGCRHTCPEPKHPKSVTLTPNGSAFCGASPGPS